MTLRARIGRRLPIVILAAILATALGGVIILGNAVRNKLVALETAASDNAQWTVSQLEVDLLKFHAAVLEAAGSPEDDLSEIRRTFDIFFSRLATIMEGSSYAPHRTDPGFLDDLRLLKGFTAGTVPAIDGPDDALRAELGALGDQARALLPTVRAVAVKGLQFVTVRAEQQREDVSATLVSLAMLATGLLAALGVLAVWLGTLSRRDARRAAEIAQASDRLRAVFSTSLDAIIVTDGDGIVRDFNDAAERIFGYRRDEAIGAPVGTLVVPAIHRTAHEAGMARYRQTGERRVIGAGVVSLEARRKNGEVFPAEISIQSSRDGAGEILISFIHDTTKRKMAEAALVEARDRALAGEKARADFLAVMSHEMRTPLNGLLGSLSLLAATDLGDRQKRHVRNMQTSGRLLLDRINDVLDITKLDSGKAVAEREPFDPERLLSEVLESQQPLAAANGNSLSASWLETPASHYVGDPGRLRQILLNLVSNAIKFTRDGEITIEAELLDRPGSSAAIEFRVIDTGIGIPEAEQQAIFEDFRTIDASYSRRSDGTGLGLGIARRLTHLLGGEIGLESEPGVGSLFWVRIPLARPGIRDMATRDADVEQDAAGGVALDILLVDDNLVNREVEREMLEASGHRVVEAGDGREAVRAAQARRFDLILMDISMPSMDGRQATEIIRRGDGRSRASRIVALTAHALPDEIEEFRRAGMNGYLTKPFRPGDLLRIQGEDSWSVPVAGGHQAAPVLDRDHVGQMLDGIPSDRLAALLRAFVAETEAMVADLPSIVVPDGHEALSGRVHGSAGAAASIGARSLHAALARAEAALREGRFDHANTALRQVEAAWGPTRQEIEAVIGGLVSPD